MKIPKDEQGDIRNMPIGMSKKLYKDGQENEHNCNVGRSISTTTCFKCMKSLNFSIMYI